MTKRLSVFLPIILMISLQGFGQNSLVSTVNPKDSISIKYFFIKGKWSGQSRFMTMVTDNEANLSDYAATAIGFGLAYRTLAYKGFQFGISAFVNQNISSPDFTQLDSITKTPNRYEIGLYDVTDVNRKDLLFRLQDFHIKYEFKKGTIILGNYLPKNLFINAQDGRMSPTYVQGLGIDWKVNKQFKIKSDLIWRIAPRSTTHWYSVENSIGYYPTGVNPDGSKSQYANQIQSAGLGILEIYYQPKPQITVILGDILVENVFNTAYLKTEYSLQKVNHRWFFGTLLVRQNATGNGGNADIVKAYFPVNNRSLIINTRLGYTFDTWESSLNMGRITGEGRFLMPREWGVEQFYTFLARERNEGAGDVWAYSTKLGKSYFKKALKVELGYGYYRYPDAKNTRLNKYGFADYTQFIGNINYQFSGFLKGLTAQVLFVRKDNQGETYNNKRYVINKVNMSQWNVIFNYQF